MYSHIFPTTSSLIYLLPHQDLQSCAKVKCEAVQTWFGQRTQSGTKVQCEQEATKVDCED